MADIVLDHVTKRYPDGALAVDDLSLHVRDGEFFILVGPSGCGKSTTLNLVAGLETISEGEVRIGGEVANDKPPQERDVAMVFQSYALYPHLSVRHNIGFALKLAKMPRGTIRRKVDEVADLLELTPYLDVKPERLSGGQRQRVAMGRAMVRDPAAFLMDEPLSNLDAELRLQMRSELTRMQQRLRATMLYVTHDQTEAMALGDRVAIMRQGVLQQVGRPQAIYERPANLFVAGFLGTPAMNLLPGRLDASTLRTRLGDVPLTDSLRQQLARRTVADPSVVVGLRPEALEEASLVAPERRPTGLVFRAIVDIVESLGSTVYVYFDAPTVTPVAAADGTPTERMVARVDAASRIHEGQHVELWADADRVQIFDGVSGINLGDAMR